MYTVLYIVRFIESVGVQAMKRTEIKRRPLSDTVLANLEPESKEYRELDGDGLYFRVKPDGKKAWLFRYKKAGGVSKSMLKKSRLDFDKIEKCE